MYTVLVYIGAAVIALWGLAHLINTGGVLRSFEPMALDTRRVVTMEWIMEGLMLAFIAVLVVVFTATDALSSASVVVYRLSAAALVVMSVVSLLTGARASFWAYKLCPAIFMSAAVLLIIGSLGSA